MTILFAVLYLLGVICFFLAAARVTARVELIGLGLGLVFLVPFIQCIRAA